MRDLLITAVGSTSPELLAWAAGLRDELTHRWPSLAASPSQLPWLSARLAGRSLDELKKLHPADLVLVSAALARDSAALATFDAFLTTEASNAFASFRLEPAEREELLQVVRERLLVGAPPRLTSYTGAGPLGAWLRAVSLRVVLNARKDREPDFTLEDLAEPALPAETPELALLRAHHRQAFRDALTAALATLTSRERNLLRLSGLDGLTLAEIGKVYARDASTISRWLDRARTTVLERTRDHLQRHLSLSAQQAESLLAQLDSTIFAQLSSMLREASK